MSSRIGHFVKQTLTTGEVYQAYLPPPLPPVPSLDMERLYSPLDKANIALGRLDGMSTLMPDKNLFLYMYIRKEAVLSSQIEGTQSSFSQLLLAENSKAPGLPMDDIAEVSSYIRAMNHGIKLLEKLPLSQRLIKETHKVLIDNARGHNKRPGEFRTVQNWIGGTHPSMATFVPPPPGPQLEEALKQFELFLNEEGNKTPTLIKAALAHAQFETLHPFLDGNGRLGRLLITLILYSEKMITSPLLYLSLYLKTHKNTYYELLQAIRTEGAWEEWIMFFLDGVRETANQAVESAKKTLVLFENDYDKIRTARKTSSNILLVFNCFKEKPISDTKTLRNKLRISQPTIIRTLASLEKLDIIKEITNNSRNKIFVYSKFLNILNEGTETYSE